MKEERDSRETTSNSPKKGSAVLNWLKTVK